MKLQVSLQQTTYRGELSGLDPSGNIIEYNDSQRFLTHSGGLVHFFDVDPETIVATCGDACGSGGGGGGGNGGTATKRKA